MDKEKRRVMLKQENEKRKKREKKLLKERPIKRKKENDRKKKPGSTPKSKKKPTPQRAKHFERPEVFPVVPKAEKGYHRIAQKPSVVQPTLRKAERYDYI